MNLQQHQEIDPEAPVPVDPLKPVQEMVSSCIQCGTCSASCTSAPAMDLTPRQLWRNVLMGRKAEIFNSKTFTLCSTCYYCTLRCPRGLPLTDAMSALKQIAADEDLKPFKKSNRFYRSFMESVKRHGRVHEMEFMTLFFWAMKDPFLPLKFTPLGVRLMGKGKVAIEFPSRESNPLVAIFRKVEEIEGHS